ncbi:FaeA/PapI family transcriptional regulator, partial [Yersinia intermedia]|uniref:FaeA/PapI family transcriptional regulator n=1 Tax=Yersinia intermedia TaxID=631 RepID=UPI002244BBE6
MQKEAVKTTRSERQMIQVYEVLSALCAQRYGPDGAIPPQNLWPKTRDIANICAISIYRSRTVLLALVARGKVQVTAHSINNSLRWFVIENK